MLSRIFAVGLLMALAGCGSADEAASKNLFSTWARQNPPGFILDMSSMTFGTATIRLFISSPAAGECDCVFAVSGTQDSGQYVLSSCGFVAGSGTDPGCSSLNSSGSYTKTADLLTLCRTGSACAEYR